MRVNERCGMTSGKKLKMSIFDRVMKSTNITLFAFIAPQAKERCIDWTRYTYLLAWFDNFKVFCLNLDLPLLDAMGSQFLMRRQCIRYLTLTQRISLLTGVRQ
jgi:hypothetical protein